MIDVIYIGNDDIIADYIYCHEGFSLKGIISESKMRNKKIFTYSLARALPIFFVSSKEDVVKIINKLKINIFIMGNFGIIIPVDKINQEKEIYNIHPSYLPDYRGRNPLYWQTVLNERIVGITLHKISEKIDEGEIISQIKVPYYYWMNTKDLYLSLMEHIKDLLSDLSLFLSGKKESKKISGGKYYRRVKKEDFYIDLSTDSPSVIYNKVRSQETYNGAILEYKGKIFRIKKLSFVIFEGKKENLIKEGDVIYIKYRNKLYIKLERYSVE
ncbi:hypothetical protein JYK00_03370 [Thermosipho ferrireducens]|uniref:Methionyl-tRNA formyltransferase n=1 Tax=Thermosipho ferrireducens TaxID=2571116 RepID=A0ABX7SAU0_9BACT|nr:formyltransferase family protein [Thermosipho ferrireducens]QTA38566.1 hypothetical protein JYK00_03370 [Thermosipho ferrireducens]